MSDEMKSLFKKMPDRFIFFAEKLFAAVIAIFSRKSLVAVFTNVRGRLHKSYVVKISNYPQTKALNGFIWLLSICNRSPRFYHR